MNPAQFSEQLAAEGYSELVTVERPANGRLDLHSHPFAARALILEGEISIEVAGVVQVFRAGDVFVLPANALHVEWYGPNGVRYLVGRK